MSASAAPPSAPELEAQIIALIRAHVERVPAADALRFLFQLDAELYVLQGLQAIRYGGGTHTKHRHIHYHDFFVQHIRAGERVLDIGCGNGAVAYDIAAQSQADVVGIDLHAPYLEQARREYAHPRVRYLQGDALTDLPDERFDVIVMSNVLEHLEQRVDFLRRVQARYRPARWLIRVPLFERDWRVPLKQELGLDYRLDPTHFIEYTQASFVDEVTRAELAIAYQETRWGEIWAEVAADAA